MPTPQPNTTLVLPDAHFGEQNEAACELVVKACAALKPVRIVHLGDLLDCLIFTSHPPAIEDAAKAHSFLNDEVEPARAWMQACMNRSGAEKWIQLEGNHEFRVARWCAKAGLAGVGIHDLLEPKRLLAKDIDGFQWVPYIPKSGVDSFYPIVTGTLIAVHGWSYAKNASAQHLERAKTGGRSVVHGHVHRQMSVATRDPFTGKVIKAWCPGTLSSLEMKYQHGVPNDWVRGFSVIYTGESSNTFTDYTVTIDHRDQAVLPDGRQLKL